MTYPAPADLGDVDDREPPEPRIQCARCAAHVPRGDAGLLQLDGFGGQGEAYWLCRRCWEALRTVIGLAINRGRN